MSNEWCNKNLEKLGARNVRNNFSRLILFFNKSAVESHYQSYREIVELIRNNASETELQQAMDKHRDNHHLTRKFTEEEIQQHIDKMTGVDNKKEGEKSDKSEKSKKSKGRK